MKIGLGQGKIAVLPVRKTVVATALLLALAGCNSGGGDSAQVPSISALNNAPVITLGEDKTVGGNVSVVLLATATDSDGHIVSTKWLQTGGTSVSIFNEDNQAASFTSPVVGVEEVLTFEFKATDNKGKTSTASTKITVVPKVNVPPVVTVNADKTVESGVSVTLRATATDSDGHIKSTKWVQTSGTAVSISNEDNLIAAFTSPIVSADEVLTFEFKATDDKGEVSSASTNITVAKKENTPPVVNAGADQNVTEGNIVTLSGSATDVDNNIASYQWKQISGRAVTLRDASAQSSTFTAPDLIADETLEFEFTVTDKEGASHSDRVQVHVSAISVPSINASLSGSYRVGSKVYVDSDINDPLSSDNIANNSFSEAQRIPNFSVVNGFSTKEGTGKQGDRLSSIGDRSDVYSATLQKDQTITLKVIDARYGESYSGDLDLYLYNSDLDQVASSVRVRNDELITVPKDGEYYIEVSAYSGGSRYVLSLEQVSTTEVNRRGNADFKAGEAIVQLNQGVSSYAAASNSDVKVNLSNSSEVQLVNFEFSKNQVQVQSSTAEKSVEQELLAKNPESWEKRKTLEHIKRLNQQAGVKLAEPNYIVQPLAIPNDALYSQQWHYPAINLPAAWDITTGSRASNDVIVAVADTGVFLDHPEFAGQLVPGYDFIKDTKTSNDGDGIDNNPDDPGDDDGRRGDSWHGTHVAGTVAAKTNNNSDIAGVAWNAKIMPLRVLGIGGGTTYDIVQSVLFAAGLENDSGTVPQQKADILNMSLGGYGYSFFAQEAYTKARNAGVIIVAASGNDNTSRHFYPASYDGVISVGATDRNNNRSWYSNYGTALDIAAPGGDTNKDLDFNGHVDGVLSTLVTKVAGHRAATTSYYDGTSMATPHVAGVLALMRAVHPSITPDQVDRLISSGQITTDLGNAGRDDLYGHGLIDAFKAVREAQKLANGGTLPELPAKFVVSPPVFNMGVGSTEASFVISNEGEAISAVSNITSDANWLSVSPVNVDVNGLGEYKTVVDRSGLSNANYQGTVTINFDNGDKLTVSVQMQVQDSTQPGVSAKAYVLLLNSENSVVAQIAAIKQDSGEYNFSFSNIDVGSYNIVAGSDVDNDAKICQLGETCGGYPLLDGLGTIQVIDKDITGLDFILDMTNETQSKRIGEAGYQRLYTDR
ncbi:S8 family peptidase [Vibrio sp. Of7-15]|uniref:S8 family serine peptidase n=1 Tax=Vibrio sp. Of7-15 TaxID=2724879 RepID=UPI001EF328AF|nr:S8 family serine peptidase [Vibrio sp. Of7-15]MCG7499402.1 S8 family peptidase [Vibrio sp. Of7-15]